MAYQELRQFGFTEQEARLWMDENPEWRTRLSNGDGRALSDDEMRALVRRGWIHSSIKLDAVRELQQFRNRWDVRAMSTSMSATQRSDEGWLVRTATNTLDTLTETLPQHLS
ncbi:MAG: hypothetical protein WKF84_08490 [Pyrinomonadaceae bacterium]